MSAQTQQPTIWQLYRQKLAESKAIIARAEQMLAAGKSRLVYVPPCRVRAHTRTGYHRVWYPGRRKETSV